MEQVTFSQLKFDELYKLTTDLLDRCVLDSYDVGIEQLTKALVMLDNAQYDTEDEEDKRQEDLFDTGTWEDD